MRFTFLVTMLIPVAVTGATPAPDAKFTYVELKDKFNHKLSEKFHGTDENVLPLGKGKQVFGDVEFQIVVREYVALDRDQNRSRRFFAQANRQTNQSIAPYTPCGWGSTLGTAVSECVKEIRRFPYEGPMPDDNAPAS